MLGSGRLYAMSTVANDCELFLERHSGLERALLLKNGIEWKTARWRSSRLHGAVVYWGLIRKQHISNQLLNSPICRLREALSRTSRPPLGLSWHERF